MTLPAKPFDGADFFASVRPLMDANRGLLGGSDGNFQYVIMDAALYRPEIFRRPTTQTFTDAGRALSADVCVLVNGQIFGLTKLDYCYLSPCVVQWQGEIIDAGFAAFGNPASRPDHRFFGRENAIPVWRNHVGRGDPSRFSRATLQYAMGTLIPLIQGRVRFGDRNIGTPPNLIQLYSNATTQWLNFPATRGKTGVGVHRDSGCLFVFCQQDAAVPGLHVSALIARLQTMNVDDAMLCDGSDSATLIVDGVVHSDPAGYKSRSIPTGIMFRLNDLQFRANGTIRIDAGSTDSTFLSSFPVGSILTGIAGLVRGGGTPGLEMNLASFGTGTPPISAQGVADLMGVGTLSIVLHAASTDLMTGTSFSSTGAGATVVFTLQLVNTPGQFDRLSGNLTVLNSRGIVAGTVTIPI